MIYEFRIYETLPGRVPAMVERFERVNIPVMRKHGIKLVGSWIPQEEDQFAYITAFESEEHREKAWQDFYQDEGWRIPYEEEKSRGPVFKRTLVRMALTPTSYSPLA